MKISKLAVFAMVLCFSISAMAASREDVTFGKVTIKGAPSSSLTVISGDGSITNTIDSSGNLTINGTLSTAGTVDTNRTMYVNNVVAATNVTAKTLTVSTTSTLTGVATFTAKPAFNAALVAPAALAGLMTNGPASMTPDAKWFNFSHNGTNYCVPAFVIP